MKARIKQSGQVVVLQEDKTIYCDGHNIYNAEDIEILPDDPATNEIDYEQRRWELVKAAMQGLLSNQYWMVLKKELAENSAKELHKKVSFLLQEIADDSIEFADAVLAEYKKTK